MMTWILLSLLATTTSEFAMVADETGCLDAAVLTETLEPLREQAYAHGYAQVIVSVTALNTEQRQVVVEALPHPEDALSWRRVFTISRADCPHMAELVERAFADRLQAPVKKSPQQHNTPVQPQADTSAMLPAAAPQAFPVHAEVILENAYSDELWTGMSLRPSLTLWDRLKLSLRVDFAKPICAFIDYGDYGSSVSFNFDYVPPWTFAISDLMFVASAPEIFRENWTHIAVGAGLTLVAPLSQISRAQTLFAAVRPNLDVNWKWAGFSLSYDLYLEKQVHRYSTADLTTGFMSDTQDMQIRLGGPENLGHGRYGFLDGAPLISNGNTYFSTGIRNVSGSIYNVLALGYQYKELFACRTGFIVQNAFPYPRSSFNDIMSYEPDTIPSSYVRTMANVELSFSPWQHLSFVLGATRTQLSDALFGPSKLEGNQIYLLLIGRV